MCPMLMSDDQACLKRDMFYTTGQTIALRARVQSLADGDTIPS